MDDDQLVRTSLERLLALETRHQVRAFGSAEEALQAVRLRAPELLITDLTMPHMTGVELYRHLVAQGRAIPTILITAYPDDRVRARALANGVLCYLSKPLDDDALIDCVRSALASPGP